jgi:predicted hotdog family 3-hydroxylacyl-ACP dehydratase
MIPDAALAARIAEACARPVHELLPHRPPMLLLDRALGMDGVDGEWFAATVRIRPGIPFFAGGEVPAWVGLEYMAQTVGAYNGALGLARGGSPKPGMLLGTRAYTAAVPAFRDGLELEVRVRIDIFQEGGVSSVDCRIRAEGVELAQAQVTVIEAPDLRTFLKERTA